VRFSGKEATRGVPGATREKTSRGRLADSPLKRESTTHQYSTGFAGEATDIRARGARETTKKKGLGELAKKKKKKTPKRSKKESRKGTDKKKKTIHKESASISKDAQIK